MLSRVGPPKSFAVTAGHTVQRAGGEGTEGWWRLSSSPVRSHWTDPGPIREAGARRCLLPPPRAVGQHPRGPGGSRGPPGGRGSSRPRRGGGGGGGCGGAAAGGRERAGGGGAGAGSGARGRGGAAGGVGGGRGSSGGRRSGCCCCCGGGYCREGAGAAPGEGGRASGALPHSLPPSHSSLPFSAWTLPLHSTSRHFSPSVSLTALCLPACLTCAISPFLTHRAGDSYPSAQSL